MIKRKLALLLLVCSTLSPKIEAALVNLNPVNLNFYPGHSIEALEITNEDDNPIALQIDAKNWQQDKKGVDKYSSTEDLLITPHLFTIAPNQTQLVRISLLNNPVISKERCYRLIIREILPIQSVKKVENRNLKITLQMLLPIFVNNTASQPIYSWSFKEAGNKSLVEIANKGDNHILVTSLSFVDNEDTIVFEQSGLFAYILPGASHQFKMELPKEVLKNKALSLQLI
ncbi:fimbrial biogenesis chaperone [Candidatus Berkiella aquae]|uniref:Fimbria/pilus periplasmic chaperone n=1 Tax=Candidatus Berkiella aquae TaxID=295108 RepID=A0A0Q9YNA0_9GAMM|nr:fimbria/pilus periplasmic chaperone [Candidatus Berkiella aquae]MCS5710953.1 fimbria/pilus periplasmic chaperone [Candidatus Berkiella aquae]